MASDITELFTLFDEKEVRESIELTFVVLIIWTFSLLQFCFVLTATRNVKRGRVALQIAPNKTIVHRLQQNGREATLPLADFWR
jgi:hypothetical protein